MVRCLKVSMVNQKVWAGILSSIVISLAAIALSTYVMTRSIQAAPMVTSTSISLGQKFNWKVAEVVDIQGNLYAYLGYEIPSTTTYNTLRLVKWQNGWLELTYSITRILPGNVTLSPYKLQIYDFNLDYLTAQFFES